MEKPRLFIKAKVEKEVPEPKLHIKEKVVEGIEEGDFAVGKKFLNHDTKLEFEITETRTDEAGAVRVTLRAGSAATSKSLDKFKEEITRGKYTPV